jgi:hypothetical protein
LEKYESEAVYHGNLEHSPIAVIKEHLWEFLERQGFKRGPVEIYGEMELLCLLDRFLDHALCFATEGYKQHSQVAGWIGRLMLSRL